MPRGSSTAFTRRPARGAPKWSSTSTMGVPSSTSTTPARSTSPVTVHTVLPVDDDVIDISRMPNQHGRSYSLGGALPNSVRSGYSEAALKLVLIGNLCNNAFRNQQGQNVGQSTEVALLNVITALGLRDEREVQLRTAAA